MQAAANAVNDNLNPVEGNILLSQPRMDPTRTMQALTWQGTNSVEVKTMPCPDITMPQDVVLKITGTTICGSDLHLYHGEIPTMKKDDILGHEFM